MTALAKLIRELKGCEAKATPGPWTNDGYRFYNQEGEVLFEYKYQDAFRIGDASKILSLNYLPTLLSIIERQQRALTDIAAHPPHFIDLSGRHAEVKIMQAGEALSDVEQLASGTAKEGA